MTRHEDGCVLRCAWFIVADAAAFEGGTKVFERFEDICVTAPSGEHRRRRAFFVGGCPERDARGGRDLQTTYMK